MRSKTLSLRPEYHLMIIRDVTPPRDREAADRAATRAGTEIAAASTEAVFIYAAQRTVPVHLVITAYSRPRAADDRDGTFRFEVDFPSGVVHFGDLSHRVEAMELPGGAGRYSVAVHHSGREAADQAAAEVLHLPDPEEQDRRIEQEAGLERYLVVISPLGRLAAPGAAVPDGGHRGVPGES